MGQMNAYESERAAAESLLNQLKPGLIAGMSREDAAKQFKLYWTASLASDHLYGHRPDGPLERAEGDWDSGQTVLLSALQRGLAGGAWSGTAAPGALPGSVKLTLTAAGITAAVTITDGKRGYVPNTPAYTGPGADWVQPMLVRGPQPVPDLLRAMALASAVETSVFRGLAGELKAGPTGLVVDDFNDVPIIWGQRRAVPDPDALEELQALTGLTEEEVREALDGIAAAAAANGYVQARSAEKVQAASSFIPLRRTADAPEDDDDDDDELLVSIGSTPGMVSISGERFKELFGGTIPTDADEIAKRLADAAEAGTLNGPDGPAVTYADKDVAGVFPAAAFHMPGFGSLDTTQKALVGILNLELGEEAPRTYTLTADVPGSLRLTRPGKRDRIVSLSADGLAVLAAEPPADPVLNAWLGRTGAGTITSRDQESPGAPSLDARFAEEDSLDCLARAFSESDFGIHTPGSVIWAYPGYFTYSTVDGMFMAVLGEDGKFSAAESDESVEAGKLLAARFGRPVEEVLDGIYDRAASLGAVITADMQARSGNRLVYAIAGQGFQDRDPAPWADDEE